MRRKKIILLFILLFSFFVSSCDKKEIKSYNIYYIVDESEIVTKAYNEDFVLTEEIALNDASYNKDGYTKDGFYLDSNYNTRAVFPYTVKESKTFYLKWNKKEANKYNVKFYNGDSLYKELVIDEGKKIDSFDAPTKENYSFKGWFDASFINEFSFTTPINQNYNLYAKWEYIPVNNEIISGYNEGIYIIIDDNNPANYNIYYSLANKKSFTKIDNQLIRLENDKIRADILGLKADLYDIKIENSKETKIIEDIVVYEADRSGYAHFNYNSGVGAYNNDGSLKENAVIVYVTNETKNTVKAKIGDKDCVGLAQILQAQANSNYPLNIRILDTIEAATWPKTTPAVTRYSEATTTTVRGVNDKYLELKNYSEEDIIKEGFNQLDESKYTKLNGLTNKIKYDASKNEFDSYYNMLDIADAKNVTIEGVGENAGLFQWGLMWKRSSSVEVKNLTFTDYTEDACTVEGSGEDANLRTLSAFTTNRIWIHNNTFNKGVNYWDVCSEQDKHDGDGTTDFKRVAYVTVSYNHYIKNHKTGLVGGGDTQMSAAITFHHNFYDECQSRLPFARQANMHMYNNYYYKSSGNNMQIYAGAYAFIENCYFDNVKNTFRVTESTSGTGTPAVKSFNNIFINSSTSGATVVQSRTQVVNNQNVFGPTFDTNSSIFYFDSANQKSDVLILNDTEDVPQIIPNYAGAGANYYKSILKTKSEISHTITLKNGNDIFLTIKAYDNEKAKIPSTTPSGNGVFKAWVDENNIEFDWNTPITNDLVLFASFTEKPSYEGLLNNKNIVLNYDFNSTTNNEILPQFEGYNKKGIFGNTNGTDYQKANAIYSNSKVQTNDNDDGAAALIVCSCGEAFEDGIVKGWIDLSIGEQKGSKWAILSFVDKNGLTILKIGANASSNLSYSLGDDPLDNGIALETSTINKNAKYQIYYEFNLDSKTTTLIINGQLYIINNSIESFSGFYTMTNSKGTGSSARIVALDNILIIKE